MAELLLKNAVILTMDAENTEYYPGYVWVRGSKIEKIGPMEQISGIHPENGCQVMDCTGKIVMPGMINTHSHLSMMVFRSLADDAADRLKRYMMPLEQSAMTREMAVAGAEYAFAELLLGGVTTVHDAYYFEKDIARVAKVCGIRGVFAETILNGRSPNAEKPYDGIAYSREFIKEWADDPLIRPAVNCHAVYTNDTEHLTECHHLAREFDVMMSMHVAEMDYEQTDCMERFGKTPVGYLNSIGVLDKKFLAAHSILLDENDLNIYQKRGVKVSCNQGANAKSAKGVIRLAEMRRRGIITGLGSDGPMSGNTIDILTQLSLIGKIQKLHYHDRTLFPAREILKMATIEGAAALGLEHETGSLENGKKADIIIFETDSINMNPIYDYASVIVYSANPSNVETTIVDGRIVMHKRRLMTMNGCRIRESIMAYHDHIVSCADKIDREMNLGQK